MSLTTLPIPSDHPVFAGHFPGTPLVPGALLLSMVLEAVLADADSAARVGPSPRVATAKFLSPVRPGDVATLRLFNEPRGLRFEVHCADRLAASGQFEAVPAAVAVVAA